MSILLWVLQIALAWMCIAGGAYQIFKIDELRKNVALAMAVMAPFISDGRFALKPF